MLSSLFSVFSAFILILSHLVNAAPVTPTEFLAFAPTIISPSNGTVWVAGSSQNVSWKTSNVPNEARNYTLTVLLGRIANNSENLDISKSIAFRSHVQVLTSGSEKPLASQVPIMEGTVSIIVPSNTTDGTNYIVACKYPAFYQFPLSSCIPK